MHPGPVSDSSYDDGPNAICPVRDARFKPTKFKSHEISWDFFENLFRKEFSWNFERRLLNQLRIQGRQPQMGGEPTYYLAKFRWEVHEHKDKNTFQ